MDQHTVNSEFGHLARLMMNVNNTHVRSGSDDEHTDCDGSVCPDCACCQHCTESECVCYDSECACGDTK